MTYKLALARLEAYAPRRLDFGDYARGKGRCAIGVLLGPLAAVAQASLDDVVGLTCMDIGTLYGNDAGIAGEIQCAGLTRDEAARLQAENDAVGRGDETPRQRYRRVVAWLRARVAAEDAAGADR